MRVAVVYESLMGNTRRVAEAIAAGARDAAHGVDVSCSPAGEAGSGDADLVFVGAPTHFFGVPRARTRRLWVNGQQSAARRGQPTPALEPGTADAGVREWLDALPTGSGRRAAAFDTRLDRPLAGGAAPRIARRLRRLGYELVAAPEGFIVEDMAGPLRAGELKRAAAWASRVVTASVAGHGGTARRRREGEAMMNETTWERWGAVSGLVGVALGVAGATFERGAPGVDAAPAQVAAFFRDYRTELLAQSLLMLLSTGALLWFLGSLRSYLARAEGGDGHLATVAFGAGVLGFGLQARSRRRRARWRWRPTTHWTHSSPP